MWSAIKSDLADFVNTIKEDIGANVSVGNSEGQRSEIEAESAQLLKDLRRSYATYAEPIEEEYRSEYDRFMKTFSLSDHGNEISLILDEDVDVPRYYAELVPTKMTPESFWGRFFFRCVLLKRDGDGMGLEEDDEELLWDDTTSAVTSNTELGADTSAFASANSGDKKDTKLSEGRKEHMSENQTQRESSYEALMKENTVLKANIRTLTSRLSAVEAELNEYKSKESKEGVIVKSSETTTTNPNPNANEIAPTTANKPPSDEAECKQLDESLPPGPTQTTSSSETTAKVVDLALLDEEEESWD